MSTLAAAESSGVVSAAEEDALPVARTWHPWRWLVGAAALVVVAQFVHGLATNSGWDWPTFTRYFTARSVLEAVRVTVELTFWGTLFGFLLGIWLAVARLSKIPVLQVIAWVYVWAFRSIPLIVQLLFWFNIAYLYQRMSIGIPFGQAFLTFDVNGVISGFNAAVIGLALHQAAYSAEIIRAGIISVDPGQPGTILDTVAAYRDLFRPSVRYPEPYLVVSADVHSGMLWLESRCVGVDPGQKRVGTTAAIGGCVGMVATIRGRAGRRRRWPGIRVGVVAIACGGE